MTIKQLQDLLLSLGVSCRVRCIGANGWTVCLTWEGGAFVVATGLDLESAIVCAIKNARSVRPLTDEEQCALERTFNELRAKYL